VTTFALVHGAWHGPWCWERLRPELEARGHRVVAVDLPSEDPALGSADYAAVVTRALRSVDGDVVVVGHSLAGLAIPLVALARPVRRLAFVCALLPQPGRSLREQEGVFVDGFGDALVRDELDRSYWPESTAEQGLYPECPPATAAWASARLRRQSHLPSLETTPLETWPAVESTYVLGERDHVLDPAWSRRAARERLGIEAVRLDAGHSPFLTCPRELADLLG
jgi:pimeloyl-ACP methyl ester carboxylesterase